VSGAVDPQVHVDPVGADDGLLNQLVEERLSPDIVHAVDPLPNLLAEPEKRRVGVEVGGAAGEADLGLSEGGAEGVLLRF
jgi:hypothetical protein